MSPAIAKWERMSLERQTAAVRELLAQDQAPSTIAFKLKAPRKEVDRLSALIRREGWAKSEDQESQSGEGDAVPPTPSLGASPAGRDSDESPAADEVSAGPGGQPNPANGQIAPVSNPALVGDPNPVAKASEDNGRISGVAAPATGEASRQRRRRRDGGERPAPNLPETASESGGFDSRSLTEVVVRSRVQVPPGDAFGVAKGGPTGMGRSDGRERPATRSEKPATSSRSAPEAAPPPAVSGNLPAAPDPSIPWTMLSSRQKEAAVLPLAKAGLSASAIASRLRLDSRNQVITVIARLQVAGHLPPAGSARGARTPRSTKVAAPKIAKPSPLLAVLPGGKPKTNQFDFKQRAADRASSQGLAPHLIAGDAREPILLEVPQSRRLTLLQLTEQTCKWPAGDPLSDDFSFCGTATGEFGPYCSYHSSLAYTPANQRQKAGLRSAERIR